MLGRNDLRSDDTFCRGRLADPFNPSHQGAVMSYLQYQDTLIYFIGSVAIALYLAASALELQAAVKKTSRKELLSFRRMLPKLLKWIYFRPKSQVIYDGNRKDSSLIYLLNEPTLKRGLILWGVFSFLPAVMFRRAIIIARDANSSEMYVLVNVLLALAIFLIFARASLFGIKLKRQS